MPVTKAKILGPHDGKAGLLIAIGVRFMVDGDDSGGGFSLVEHPLPPRTLAAPLHRHSREDEYSFVLRGRVGALSDGVTVVGEQGDLIFKPRHAWHTFWNAGDEPASILEIISPAGFERFFEKLVDMPGGGPPDPALLGQLAQNTGSRWTSRASRACSRNTASVSSRPAKPGCGKRFRTARTRAQVYAGRLHRRTR